MDKNQLSFNNVFLGCLNENNQFKEVVICTICDEGMMDIKTKKKYFGKDLSRIGYEVNKGVISYPHFQLTNLVSVSLLKKWFGKNKIQGNYVDSLDSALVLYNQMFCELQGKQIIKK